MDLKTPLWPQGPLLLLLLWAAATSSSTLTTSEHHSSIPAFSGTTVTLPCEAPRGSDLENLALEWTRPDLKESYYVFLFRDGRPYLVYQDSQFEGRVELGDPTLQSGDLSIKLHDIGPQDSGRYECHVFSQSHVGKRSAYNTEPIKTIDLTVKEPEYIEAFPGQDAVFPLDKPDFNVKSLMWKREDDPEHFVFLWGMDPPHHQHPQYSGRTALQNQDQSNLSMILRRVQPSDSGTYHGFIIQSQRRTKRQLYQEPDRVIIFKVLTSGALRPEGGVAFVITVLISMLLKTLE